MVVVEFDGARISQKVKGMVCVSGGMDRGIPGKGWVVESGAIHHPGIGVLWGNRVFG